MFFGFLNINKPKGMTSHDVVAVLRKITKIKQIGHTGTLDPLAQGVLPIAVGKASRLIEYLAEDKAYIATLEFGKISDTYDTEGNIELYSDIKVSNEEIEKALENFDGEIEQIPPAYSAVHYNGKRLYELARQGIIPDDIPKRKVFISKIKLTYFDYETQTAKIEIACSKGTYIRSIINDLGHQLNCGAIMTDLIRTKSGEFTIENSIDLNLLKEVNDVDKIIINPIDILNLKTLEITTEQIEKIKHGQSLNCNNFKNNEFVLLINNNILYAVAQKSNNKLITKKVFIQ